MNEDIKDRDEEVDRIHMDEGYEVQAWCELFEISIVDLKHAIEAVGPSAVKVKYYLEENNIRRSEHLR
ncbi:DUF3606 domain-containing protein [Chryseolinea sp. H1M3-3]|uniref:DUF3606 domain-containing protein n=1 Tax=Chryseolinea sp. H1M3-3 TaxID=3034144 RepID=UPI0023ED740E|nr:DUF3606 domain-containing protein [Chryseolinea sp. H1M3-3]